MNAPKWIGIVVVVVVLIAVAYLVGQNSNNSAPAALATPSDATTPAAIQTALPSAASYGDMVNSCQSIADANIRDTSFEGDFSYQTDAQPIQATDKIYFNASESTCYFTEHIVNFPRVYGGSDPSVVEKDYLYTAALLPSGVMQHPSAGDSEVGGPLPMAYCIIQTYQVPAPGSTQTHCVDFQLKQSGAGTDDYHANALGVGATISRSQYEALAQEVMGQ